MSKKGSQSQNKDQSYDVRDIVLAKVRGFPPWPGMIVDPNSIPEPVAKERPNAKTKKGNWYCVRFFPAGDYAWMVPKDISRLQQHEIEAYISEPHKRSGDLMKGYRIALDPKAWEEERDAALVEAQEAEADAEVDQLESDGEAEADDDDDAPKKRVKKRKRESEVAPRPKTKAKKDSAEPTSKKRAASAPKGKKTGPKSKAMVESEDEGGAEDGEREGSGPSKRSSPPPAKKAKRDKDDDADSPLNNDPEAIKVREWRHKLQKAFLNNKATPKGEDMPTLDQLFSTVETYENMTIEYLTVSPVFISPSLLHPHTVLCWQRVARCVPARFGSRCRRLLCACLAVWLIICPPAPRPQFSKIGKVMRHIHALSTDKVPRDDEFKFRDRAKVLVDKWHEILKTNGPPESKPAANGTRKAADAEDTAVPTNGNAENGTEAKTNGAAMEIDADAKGEEDPAAESVPDVDAKPADDASANSAVDESVLADVTMSEAA
ncbi:hypothetical protein BC628DRAFT_1066217 [Trametes gibbosa]|nr:hypothetical protein BC628DRAFT_1066217 [Trametes gibbosa]